MRGLLVARARVRRNPFTETEPAVAAGILERLDSTDHEPWVAAFMEESDRHAEREEWLAAYGYARVARYPVPSSPLKRVAYDRSRELYLRAMAGASPPLERVAIPGAGPAYLRRPPTAVPVPIVACWGGIDAFKEERRTEAYLRQGWATLALDMPGTGESADVDANAYWDAVFDRIGSRSDLDARRVAIVGNSTGGYWAAKLAHTHRQRIAAAVDHGGPAHHAFTREWIARAERGEYPFEYADALARAFRFAPGAWADEAPRLSLLAQGVLDRPCAPLLLVDGEDDSVFPIADLQLVLSRGGPKWSRILPGGHMGNGDATGAIVAWLREWLT